MATRFVVTGEQYMLIDGRMTEIKRQLRQSQGSPLDPDAVAASLQRIIEPGCGCHPADHGFTFDVDFDDPQWQRLEEGPGRTVGRITAADYSNPFRGRKRVTAVLDETDHDVRDAEMIARAQRRGDRMPVRPIVETFSRVFPTEQRRNIVGICGDPVHGVCGSSTPYVELHSGGMALYFRLTNERWTRGYRFLFVRQMVDLPPPPPC